MRKIGKLGCGVLLSAVGFGAMGSSARAATVFGITTDSTLFKFDSSSPGVIQSGLAITGFVANGTGANERLIGIDFRPSTGQLFGLSNFGRLYTVDTATAVLTPVGSGVGTIDGTAFGFDFNPTIDRIRLTSNTNKNSVIDPNSGTLQTAATDLFYGPSDPNFGVDPNIVGSAYSNNVLGVVPASSQLYDIDSGLEILATQANNAGTLGTVGPLGLNTGDLVGFDIFSPDAQTNIAYASLTPVAGSISNFYSISLATGAATNLGTISGGTLVTDIAVQPIPEPAALGLLGLGALGVLGRRRR